MKFHRFELLNGLDYHAEGRRLAEKSAQPPLHRRLASALYLVTMFAWLLLAPGAWAQDHGAAARPRVGVINFDAYFRGSRFAELLSPKQFNYRLPFYASSSGKTPWEPGGDTQETVDMEILYAAKGGIDYFIYAWYDNWKLPDGFPYRLMNRSRELYHQSAEKDKMNFCLHITPSLEKDPRVVKLFIHEMKDPKYETVMGGRPILYFWPLDRNGFQQYYGGSWEAVRESLETNLIEPAMKAGLPRPYLVVFSQEDDKEDRHYIDDLGFDAVSQYATFAGGTYKELTQRTERLWSQHKKIGKVIPHVVTGWDPSPHEHDPSYPFFKGYIVDYAMPDEISDHLKHALNWVKANRSTAEANTVILYAWNEFTEGGWLTPTYSEGNSRLDAIAKVLRADGASPPEAGTQPRRQQRPATGTQPSGANSPRPSTGNSPSPSTRNSAGSSARNNAASPHASILSTVQHGD